MARTDTTAVPAQFPIGWVGVAEALEYAAGLSFDGCHKIYILLDEEQVAQQESYGYGSDGDSELVLIGQSDDGRASAYAIVQDWYASSCQLRFVQGIATVPDDDDDRFYSIIRQFEEAE